MAEDTLARQQAQERARYEGVMGSENPQPAPPPC
jgi:hypothetical protein